MKHVTNIGNIPEILKSFLLNTLFGEGNSTDVFDCTYDEIINKAKIEKLEPTVIIDKKNTGRGYLCAVGASIRTMIWPLQDTLKPVFYFAELDEPRKRQFQQELKKARTQVFESHKTQLDVDKRLKAAAREGSEKLKNGKTRSN
ncbi:MAG TPA: hypothetical protein VI911_10110 [Patescibacteria group bacterium]|nr:hypothetical protein [Patescibacteria group bacterium]